MSAAAVREVESPGGAAGAPAGPDRSTERLLAVCRELACRFAPRAARADRDAAFPVENFEDLRRAGLLALWVPRERGGWGAGFFDHTRVLEELAIGDAATALALNMHHISVGSLAELDLSGIEGRRGRQMNDFRNWIYEQALAGRVFASATSEPKAGPRIGSLTTTYRRVPATNGRPAGFIINGVKSFVSLAGYADYYLVAARMADEPGAPVSHLVVEASNPGIRFDNVWDVMGMRATTSNNMYIEDCFVPEDRLFLGIEGTALYKAIREPHWYSAGYNGVYLGLCEAIFRFVTRYLKEKREPTTGEPKSADRLVQHQVGQMSVDLESARAVVYDAARRVDVARGAPETSMALHRAKYMVGELGPRMASDAIRICGGRTIFRSLPLERYYRDARCGGLMPAASDECLVYVGKLCLDFDPHSTAVSYF